MAGRRPHGVWFGELDLGPEVNFILLPLGPLDNGDSGECEFRWVMRVFLQKLLLSALTGSAVSGRGAAVLMQ